MKIRAVLCCLFMLLSMGIYAQKTPIASHGVTVQSSNHKPPAHAVVPLAQGKIAAFVYHTTRHKGKAFAHEMAKMLYDDATKFGICPYWAASTAYVESGFNWNSQSQIGYMQFTRLEARQIQKEYGYNIRNQRDNVKAGALYLALLSHSRIHGELSSRSGDRSDTRKMFKASATYNDGPNGTRTRKGQRYASKVLRVRNIIMHGQTKTWDKM